MSGNDWVKDEIIEKTTLIKESTLTLWDVNTVAMWVGEMIENGKVDDIIRFIILATENPISDPWKVCIIIGILFENNQHVNVKGWNSIVKMVIKWIEKFEFVADPKVEIYLVEAE